MIRLGHLIVENANAGASQHKTGRSGYQRCRLTMGADRHGNRGVAASRKTSRLLLLLTIPPPSLSQSFKSNTTQHRNAMTDACVFMLCLGDRKEEEDEARTSSTALNDNNDASHGIQHR